MAAAVAALGRASPSGYSLNGPFCGIKYFSADARTPGNCSLLCAWDLRGHLGEFGQEGWSEERRV